MSPDRKHLRVVASNEAGGTVSPVPPLVVQDLDWTILMSRAQAGDTVAYHRLLNEITPYLRHQTRRWHSDHHDVEDTVQDILLTVHAVRHTYDPTRPFGPWLIGIANRRAFDRLRKQGRQRMREAPLMPEHEDISAPLHDFDVATERRHLQAAIEQLPPTQQKAIRLLKLKEMTLNDASVATGLSIGSLKVATHRALASLRSLMGDRSDSE